MCVNAYCGNFSRNQAAIQTTTTVYVPPFVVYIDRNRRLVDRVLIQPNTAVLPREVFRLQIP